MWEAFLDAEPGPVKRIPAGEIDGVADAFARYVDLKSPFTLEHSTGVARLAEAAAETAAERSDGRNGLEQQYGGNVPQRPVEHSGQMNRSMSRRHDLRRDARAQPHHDAPEQRAQRGRVPGR